MKTRLIGWLPIILFVLASFTCDFSAGAEENVIAQKYKKLMEAKLVLEKEIEAAELAQTSEAVVDRNVLRKSARSASFDVLVNGDLSNNPDHLNPFVGATWVFVDKMTFSIFPDWDPRYSSTSIFFDAEIQPAQDSVKLICHDSLDRSCELVAYTVSDAILHYLRITVDDPKYPDDDVLIMEISGNVAIGEKAYIDEEKGEIWGIKPMTGFKWGSPVCDKNYDDKLGLAEAIHYLRLVAGE